VVDLDIKNKLAVNKDIDSKPCGGLSHRQPTTGEVEHGEQTSGDLNLKNKPDVDWEIESQPVVEGLDMYSREQTSTDKEYSQTSGDD
jgi:hypothetical protein